MELDKLGGLVVIAPRHWSEAYIGSILSENTSRVQRFISTARQRQATPLNFGAGTMHLYLGERYPLELKPALGRKSNVSFNGHEIHIQNRQHDAESVRKVLQGWYEARAMKVLNARLQTIAARADWVRITPVPMKLRRMKRTWGNCSSSGLIKLNTHLIKAPPSVIDSVVAHEICHLQEMNHGKAFYALLEQLNPNWRADRLRLRSDARLYLQ
jgi:hypothetical protein